MGRHDPARDGTAPLVAVVIVDGWHGYIFRKMRRPLIRELFDHESARIYPGKFPDYVMSRQRLIEAPCDPNAF